jgi:hypothetical protein
MSNTKIRPGEMLAQMGVRVYEEAINEKMSLSAYLEKRDPSNEYRDGTDAFQRLLMAADIRTDSLPQHGIRASTYQEFFENKQARALIPEWLRRLRIEAQTGQPFSTRALYASNDAAAGSWERPYAEAANARWSKQIAPAIPLSEVVAITTPVDAGSYKAYYLHDDSNAASLRRVAEGAEVPRAKLVGGEHTINLYKYGRGLEATYEQLMRQRLDKLALHVRRMAVQAEVDKVAAIIDVMVNGDGNDNAPTTHNVTTLDPDATAGTLTLKAWLAFKMKFANPYALTSALTREDVALQMFLLNTGSANTPLVAVQQPSGLGAFTAMNPGLRDNVAVGWTVDAPAQKVVAFDNRFAIERIVDVAMSITEIEQFITRQTQVLVMTESEGYAIIDENAIAILDVNA